MTTINSDAVHFGRNRDLGSYRDDRYIRCARCGFIAHLDRDRHANETSRQGWGFVYPSTTLDGVVTAGDATITLTSSTGFRTPATGSITAFATNKRLGTIVTSSSHGLKGGKVLISSTTSYNGTWFISDLLDDSFVIRATFVADDATGTWIQPEHVYVHDHGSYATDEDVSSTYTAATGGPRVDKIKYTGISGNNITGCTGALAHDDDVTVKGDPPDGGCPFCGTLLYNK